MGRAGIPRLVIGWAWQISPATSQHGPRKYRPPRHRMGRAGIARLVIGWAWQILPASSCVVKTSMCLGPNGGSEPPMGAPSPMCRQDMKPRSRRVSLLQVSRCPCGLALPGGLPVLLSLASGVGLGFKGSSRNAFEPSPPPHGMGLADDARHVIGWAWKILPATSQDGHGMYCLPPRRMGLADNARHVIGRAWQIMPATS